MNDETKLCPKCGTPMERKVEPDEKPDGTILGYAFWQCPKCENWEFDDEPESIAPSPMTGDGK